MKPSFFVWAAAPILLFPTAGALAQAPSYAGSIDYTLSVKERPIIAREPSFTRLGSWKLIPDIKLDVTHDDNIFATPNITVDDLITVVSPRARLESDWSRHSVGLEAGADLGFYDDYSSEDYQDYYVTNRNVFEMTEGTNLTADLRYQHAHTPRTSPNSLEGAVEPEVYDLLSGALGFERKIGVLTVRADGKLDQLTYEDGERIGGGTIDNADQDRSTLEGGLRFGYQPFEGSELYFSARLREIDYDDPTRDGGPNRDNDGYDLNLGLTKTVSDLWTLDAYLGYAPRDYADSALDDLSGGDALTFGVQLTWNPTPLTSVIASLDRRAYETNEAGASANLTTAMSLRVEHQLLRQLILDARLGYSQSDYVGSSRDDDEYRLDIGASYYLTKLLSVRAGWEYSERDSSDAGQSYDKNVVSLQLRVNY